MNSTVITTRRALRTMRATALGAVALATLALAACSLSRPAPDRQSFLLNPPGGGMNTGPSAVVTRDAPSVRVNRFAVAQPFGGKSLVYRLDDHRYETDFYHQFLALPGTMLTEGTIGFLGAHGRFRATVPMSSSVAARYVLEASVTSLLGDFRAEQAPAAVMAVRFLLARDSADATVLYDRLIEKRVPIPARTPQALVAGLDTAFAQVLTELDSDLRKLTLP